MLTVISQQPGGEEADPSTILLVPVEQFNNQYLFTTPSGVATSYINYVTIVIPLGTGQVRERESLIGLCYSTIHIFTLWF